MNRFSLLSILAVTLLLICSSPAHQQSPVSAAGMHNVRLLQQGEQALLVMKGDSVFSIMSVDPDAEHDVILQFRNPPLSVLFPAGEPRSIGKIASSRDALHAEHARFRSDAASIASLSPGALKFTQEYESALNGFALRASRRVLEELRRLPYVSRIDDDRTVQAIDDSSNAVIGAPAFWGAYSSHGENIDIAIIDTGIDYFHEALGGAPFPNSKVVGGYDIVNNDADPMDDHGHGTHVAGIAAGDGPPPTNLRGVAYKASLWAFKVLNARGSGTFSGVIAGIERALDPDGNPLTPTPIKVISMSLGGSGDPDDPVSTAIDHATAAGIVCAVAAGNSGPRYQSIASPGCARRALTVGATYSPTDVAYFSSRGPTNLIFALKPDVVAPGVAISSAKRGGGYVSYSGTSMATPHVAGAAALLRQIFPSLAPDEVKAAILESAADLSLDSWTQGSGRLDVLRAARDSLIITPPSLSFGLDDVSQPVWYDYETLTIHNFHQTTETVLLSHTPDVPAGMTLSFSSDAVTVSPGDSAKVEVTLRVDNSVLPFPSSSPPSYGTKILAVSSTQSVSIPAVLIKSPVLKLRFDDPPLFVFIHNRNDSSFFSIQAPGNDSMAFLVPADTFDVESFYYFDSMLVVKEGIEVNGIRSVSVHKSEAGHEVSFRTFDPQGNAVNPSGISSESISRNGSRFRLWLLSGSPSLRTHQFFSTLSPDYRIEKGFLLANGNTFYQSLFLLKEGITGPAVLMNDPTLFKRVNYRFFPDPPARALSITPLLYSSAFGFGSTLASLSSPMTMTGLYSPAPEDADFRTVRYWVATDTGSFPGNLRYMTSSVSVLEPDTMKFSWYPFPAAGNVPKFSSVAKSFTEPVGAMIPIWTGGVSFTGYSVQIQPWMESYFVSPLGDVTSARLPLTLSAGNSTFADTLRNGPLWSDSKSYNVSQSPCKLTVSFENYQVGSLRAKVSVIVSGSNGSSPRIVNLQLLRDGNLPDSLPPNEILVTPGRDSVPTTVSVFYRSLQDTGWTNLPAAWADTVLHARLPDGLPPGFYSLRILMAKPTASLDYRAEPAFTSGTAFVSERTLNFDSVGVGCHGSLTVDVRNLSVSRDLVVQSVRSDHPEFAISPSRGISIPPYGDLAYTATFTPLSAGEKNGHVVFALDNADTLKVSGTGVGPGSAVLVTARLAPNWQLISLPVDPACPYVLRNVFSFRNRYAKEDTLVIGRGYWKKLSDSTLSFSGFPLNNLSLDVAELWNLVGSVSYPVARSSIVTSPPGIVISPFYEFDGAYHPADSIRPGHAYWVKTNHPGKILMDAESHMDRAGDRDFTKNLGELVVRDAKGRSATLYFGAPATDAGFFELPPRPPDGAFDARFPNDQSLAVPGHGSEEFFVRISSAQYPLSIAWTVHQKLSASLLVGSKNIPLDSSGAIEGVTSQSNVALRFSGAALPHLYALHQNFPNPFNPKTSIRLEIPRPSRVSLKVFDVLGQEVATLIDGVEDAGYRAVDWYPADAASGVYFLRMDAAALDLPAQRFTEVRKMLLVR